MLIVVYPDEFLSHHIARGIRRKGLDVRRFESVRAAWMEMKSPSVSALVVPFEEPEFGRLGALSEVRAEPTLAHAMVIVAKIDPDFDEILDAYGAGADLVLDLKDPEFATLILKILRA
ncbi:MAG: hypothetical protein M9921_10585 [Fimbriimonadaceae bacterium]|nr:hypothetical protein [Chthonomonadaceae bacterium]MCO5297292.1 hypothetical protein [Fimbriimonadaceae bacterium]